jgi:hypothetical protein
MVAFTGGEPCAVFVVPPKLNGSGEALTVIDRGDAGTDLGERVAGAVLEDGDRLALPLRAEMGAGAGTGSAANPFIGEASAGVEANNFLKAATVTAEMPSIPAPTTSEPGTGTMLLEPIVLRARRLRREDVAFGAEIGNSVAVGTRRGTSALRYPSSSELETPAWC